MRTATSRLLAVLVAALTLLLGMAAPSQADNIGARWNGPIRIYDATGDARWGVALAAQQWAGSGVDIATSSSPCAPACITVVTSPMITYAGLAQWTRSGATITGCTVTLPTWASTQSWAHHSVLHELGHCFGLAHTTRRTSIMYPTVSGGTYMTKPSGWDLSELRKLYRG